MRRLWVALVAVTLVAAACGGDGGGGSGGAPPVSLPGQVNNHGTKTASAKVELEMDDFYFGPTFIKATAGQSITIELSNEGSAPHTFTIAGGVDEEIQPGTKKTVTVTAPATGSVTFTCRFHVGLGMQGAIFVA